MCPWGLPMSDHPSSLHHPRVRAGPVPEHLSDKGLHDGLSHSHGRDLRCVAGRAEAGAAGMRGASRLGCAGWFCDKQTLPGLQNSGPRPDS